MDPTTIGCLEAHRLGLHSGLREGHGMGDYVDIDGVHTWFETVGKGEPLVLMHGGLETNAAWAGQLASLGEYFRVLAPERRGHGHTPDVDGQLSYSVMADDTIAFIQAVIHAPAHLVGWSDGAIVGLLVALRRPDLVRKLVLIGGNADVSGCVEVPPLDQGPAGLVVDELRAAYEAVSPDGPGHWPVVFAKTTDLWTTPDIPLTDLGQIHARTLVLVGDDDLITLEHSVALYRAIPCAELAVVPGASHMVPVEKPDLVNHMLLDFLRLDAAPTLMPVRRSAAPAPGQEVLT